METCHCRTFICKNVSNPLTSVFKLSNQMILTSPGGILNFLNVMTSLGRYHRIQSGLSTSFTYHINLKPYKNTPAVLWFNFPLLIQLKYAKHSRLRVSVRIIALITKRQFVRPLLLSLNVFNEARLIETTYTCPFFNLESCFFLISVESAVL